MESYTNENDLWKHALSLEEKRKEIDLQVELQALKELFYENLPIGENTKEIDSYFNRLEEAIVNKEHVEREEFPESPDHGCDESAGGHETAHGGKRDYKYFSADVFKKQASRHPPQPSQENVDCPRLCESKIGDAQSESKESQSLASVPEHPGGRGNHHGNVESTN